MSDIEMAEAAAEAAGQVEETPEAVAPEGQQDNAAQAAPEGVSASASEPAVAEGQQDNAAQAAPAQAASAQYAQPTSDNAAAPELDGPVPPAPGTYQLIQIGGEKADLKAVREAVGINQIDLANLMDVTVRTIKRWEQIGWEEPPDEVWDLLFDLVQDHERSVAELVERTEASARAHAAERRAAGRDPWIVELPYYKNQDHYEQFPHRPRSQHAWGNAISRRAADILRLKGYTVYFYYPEGKKSK